MEQRITPGALPKPHGMHDMILSILFRVSAVLKATGRDNNQVDVFLNRAEQCPCPEELVRLAGEYVKLDEQAPGSNEPWLTVVAGAQLGVFCLPCPAQPMAGPLP